MTDARFKIFASNALVCIAAGLASALMFLVAARGTFAGALLGYFAPLPLMVACLSYNMRTGLGALAVGSLVVVVFLRAVPSLFFALCVASPGILLSLSLIAAPPRAPGRPRDLAPNWAVLTALAIVVLIVGGSTLAFIVSVGGFDAAIVLVDQKISMTLDAALRNASLPDSIDRADLSRMIIRATPMMMAASGFFMLLLNLWIAGRVALLAGGFPRPWPLIADDLALPALLGFLFLIACGATFLGGQLGLVASIAAASLGAAFSLQGIAVIHVVTRGTTLRPLLLSALYALIALVPIWPIVALAVVGLVDAVFSLRTHKSVSHPV